ncbi:MAG: exonuclease SbcD, partial [Kiritimatiellia bacterium]
MLALGLMRILHTADWHLGKLLMNRSRQAEHAAFLNWLLDTIRTEQVDALIVAGDIFDTGTPPNYALELFFDFCARLGDAGCQAVFTGGNHDSPATLRAPSAMLRRLGITLIGDVPADLNDAVVQLKDRSGAPGALLCAIPFIRDGEARRSAPGESY